MYRESGKFPPTEVHPGLQDKVLIFYIKLTRTWTYSLHLVQTVPKYYDINPSALSTVTAAK